jgi:hypothetical protein
LQLLRLENQTHVGLLREHLQRCRQLTRRHI